jgi:hypothetical protein
MSNKICTDIANKYTNTILKKITNVYQLQYIDFKPPGLGDYIRGCFCMMQLIYLLNKYCKTEIEFDMDLRNHPLSKYIICNNNESCTNYKDIGNFHIDVLVVKEDETDIAFQHILREMVNYANKLKVANFNTFCCKFAIFNTIDDTHRDFIRSKFLPNSDMESYIDSVIAELGLHDYQVLHIRCRDELSFPPKPLTDRFLNTLNEHIATHINNKTTYLLITNHNDIKKYLVLKRPNLVAKTTEICHSGQDTYQTDIQIRDTLLDFFIMSRSSGIIAFSPYGLTGFSLECSKIFNIPYRFVSL